MKKKLTRILAVILVAMMIIPAIATIVARAEEEFVNTPPEEIVNLFNQNGKAAKNAQPDPANGGKVVSKNGELASETFAVQKKQYIYVGPCTPGGDKPQLDWIIAWYIKELGTQETAVTNAKPHQLAVVDTFEDGSVIYKVQVSSRTPIPKYAAVRSLAKYFDYMLITIDQPFNKEGYYAYADAQGWDINSAGLRPIPPEYAPEAPENHEGLWNLFPREGERDPELRQHNNNTYVTSDFIPVEKDDVITMGAISTSETRSILYTYDAEFKEIKNYKRTDIGIDYVEDLGYSFATYKHVVPEGVKYVKVTVHSGVYNDGDILVTRNQPFTGAQLRETLGIDELSDEAKAHPFYGKKALFVGDSISYGSYDTPPTYRNPSASWARRLAIATGLIPTNISYPGASVGKTGLSNVKWEYDLLNQALGAPRTYDMVVFHGGVNDARQDVVVGEALPADTDRKTLVANDRVATFAGGLQLMFHDTRNTWPEAELYYIANFKLVDKSVKDKDMSEYYAQAKILCAEYGVHYIDLYDDVTLYETFDYESTDVLSDLIHPNSAAYDLLFPTVLRLFNETLSNDNPTPDPDNGNTDEEDNKGLSLGAIIGIVAGAVVVVAAAAFAVYQFVFKKKATNKKNAEKKDAEESKEKEETEENTEENKESKN